jgi:hypothetical protein
MHAIAIVVLAVSTAGVCIVRIAMYRTLRRYGVDPYSRGWRHASSWSWVLKYRELCAQHGLSLRYWNLFWLCVASAGALATAWLALLVVQLWRDLAP